MVYVLLDLEKVEQHDFQVKINAIEKEKLNESSLKVALADDLELPYDENSLSFFYSVPDYNDYVEVEYQYRIEGMLKDWSTWSPRSEASFENLPSGAYTFSIRARMGNVISENIDSFSFVVLRPWYFSNIFILIYIVLFFLLIGGDP